MIAERTNQLRIKTAVKCHCINPKRRNFIHQALLTDYSLSSISIEMDTAYPPGTILVIRPNDMDTHNYEDSFFPLSKTHFLGEVKKSEVLGDEWHPRFRLLLYSLQLETPQVL